MRTKSRITIWTVSLIMVLTCFAPVVDFAYAEDDGGQTQATQSDPNADFTGTRGGIYYENGVPKTGKANGIYYVKGKPKTGWVKKTYYENGKIKTGWVKNKKGKRIYYCYKGKKKTGWVKNKKGKKEYYCKKGKPLKGVKKVKKTWYEFNKKTGKLKRKIGDNMDKKAQDYSSNRSYLVMVSYSRHQVRIYKGKENKWKRIKKFKCSMGKSSTPTPTGTFSITRKGRYFNTGSYGRCWYWTGFIRSEYLFHSVLYNRNSSPTYVIDGRLGKNISHGCIRMKLKNARWMYYNVPSGSKVVIKREL